VTVLSGLGGGHLFSPHIRRFTLHPCEINSRPVCRRWAVSIWIVVGIDFIPFEFVVSVVRS
jgi:hypothetical protein